MKVGFIERSHNENETIRNYRQRVSQCEALGEYAMAEHIRDILINGPKRIQELAEKTNCGGWYHGVYRIYSAESHATNALESLHATHQAGKAALQPIRYPVHLPNLAQMAVSMALRTYRTLIRMLLPGEETAYGAWYTQQLRDDYVTLDQFKINDPGRPSRNPPKR